MAVTKIPTILTPNISQPPRWATTSNNKVLMDLLRVLTVRILMRKADIPNKAVIISKVGILRKGTPPAHINNTPTRHLRR
ncbi:unnamed protein product [Parascedosporium putredinis]|uniref:Uncharacterized protein n=1 Tax=Parascedosporium putredinis TaxID=1442378 RepID=A0A9P1GVE2_9PEZI|nr:unnamed protein product [Parascedosporium putredinis]CAI7987734.1 unnamed protein product [Parascedosporium putredinis]